MNNIEDLEYSVNDSLKHMTILYIEDEVNIRLNISKTLQLICKNVLVAPDAEIALDLYNTNTIDIILSDINLPGMSGLEFTRLVREKDRLIPVILLTAHTNTSFLLEAAKLRLIDYLTKPISFEVLHDALKAAAKDIIQNGTYFIEFQNETTYNVNKKILQDNENKKELKLTASEIELLEYLIKYNKRVISSEELKSSLWDDPDLATESALKNLLNKLRSKIGKESITNISGIGYRLNLK